MGESWDAPDGEDEQASLAMLQQLMAGRHALIGKLRPHQRTGLRQELSTQDVFQALGTLQGRPPSPNTGSSLQDVKQTLLAQARQHRGQGATLSQNDNEPFALLSVLVGQNEEEGHANATTEGRRGGTGC